ncbi:lipoyl protein ligase domain-containing protein [Luteolibacter pohnpeiensis]|uniref:lipoyl protein ligase domain-containing protein n=1 Tax=Luteolibacter pohnpeiensis TaxID=454153 RepID=UPI001905C317|nr:hypothetical protein [Luteolibacter pohnpeiensis]
MQLWQDPERRSGPEAMAVDEWLLETSEAPILRVYEWAGDWASLGYFGDFYEASRQIPGVRWVRRRSGGGVVDHRRDWTYTLVVPIGWPMATLRGAESYRQIHAALAEALRAEGIATELGNGETETGAALCFENPVCHDLVAADGRKLAGAGQRRTKFGLLHQGSVALPGNASRAEALASVIAEKWQAIDLQPPVDLIRNKAVSRFPEIVVV